MSMIRKAKRKYNRLMFQNLLELASNSKRFWEKSKKLLHKHHKMKKIPIQCTYDEDGIPRSALSRWESTFKEPLSSPKTNTDQFPVHTSTNHNDGSSESEILLNADIVCQAVCSLKAGKAAGPEQIPSEVLKYNICVKFFTALFSTFLKNISICLEASYYCSNF